MYIGGERSGELLVIVLELFSLKTAAWCCGGPGCCLLIRGQHLVVWTSSWVFVYCSLQVEQPPASLFTRTPASAKVWTSLDMTISCLVLTSSWRWGSWRPRSSTHLLVWCSLAILSSLARSTCLRLQSAQHGIFFFLGLLLTKGLFASISVLGCENRFFFLFVDWRRDNMVLILHAL